MPLFQYARFFQYWSNFSSKEVLDNYEKFVIIVGSPRSGSTLLSQIINGHPNMLCSSEAGVERIYSQDNNQTSLQQIVNESYSLFVSGFSKSKRFRKTIHQYQPKWVDPNFPPKERTIRVCGDKGLYRLVAAFDKNPETITTAMKMLRNVHLILTVRDPLEMSMSALKSHSHQFQTIHQALDFSLKAYELCENFINNFGFPVMVCPYEDLLARTDDTLDQITSFLEVPSKPEWLSACKLAVMNSQKKRTNLSLLEQSAIKRIHINYSSKYLKRYNLGNC
jgi:hypothetical protein